MKQPKSQRAPFAPRRFVVSASAIQDRAMAAISNMPIDPLRPLQVEISEVQKKRGQDANSLMWAGPLHDLAEQAWLEGRSYRAEIWHEWAKRSFLPEEYDPELCLKGYEKWAIDPTGERVLIGSTTMLTVRGMSDYIEQLYAAGAALGVQFSANPMEGKP